MDKFQVNIGVTLKAESLDAIKEIVFNLRKMVTEAAQGKATGVTAEILGCEKIKKEK